ncbi:carbonic anhydrase [Coprinopsis marcescibilis]|uniref:Carbonic anhydrase n=1 Tax=Coprinopsis marcescibilis TaxID=230819 RepID=A0A5C3KZD9_COPMA|nr:carbonic anhydrase [Coprinopsis marcescibilis]
MLFKSALLFLAATSSVLATPLVTFHNTRSSGKPGKQNEFNDLAQGNKRFRHEHKHLITELSEGQHPEYLFFGCSDSRASEGTIFDAKPGTLFTERNIANTFKPSDVNAKSVIAYGVEHLHVKHIIVMGHYGCGGVAASTLPAPEEPWDEATTAIQEWITPIRELYSSSTHPDIVALREANAGVDDPPSPELENPGFRALVEENVRSNVWNIAAESLIEDHWSNPSAQDLFIHGWVYDIATGTVHDLGVSVGAPGKPIPPAPWSAVQNAAQEL